MQAQNEIGNIEAAVEDLNALLLLDSRNSDAKELLSKCKAKVSCFSSEFIDVRICLFQFQQTSE